MLDTEKLKQRGLRLEPYAEGHCLYYSDMPSDLAIKEIQLCLGGPLVLKPEDNAQIGGVSSSDDLLQAISNADSDSIDISSSVRLAVQAKSENDQPMVQLLDELLAIALVRGASDLHIDPVADSLLVRLRLDGVLCDLSNLDMRVAKMLVTRIKVLSNLDIAENRRPQDGRLGITFRGKEIDIRVATLPVAQGERVVLRFFQNTIVRKSLQDTGLKPEHIRCLHDNMAQQSGLILVAGPTGSGKTTTIYSMLNTLLGRGLNIMTIEDPIEVDLDGVIQSQVNTKVGFDFAQGLRSLLRNDPDVILVGEIRDSDTATTAVRAAMTGHLVISTVHANTPVGALKRVIDLGVEKSLLSEAIIGVFSQRLVRTYCPHCRSVSITEAAHNSDIPASFSGCSKCYGTGYIGRVPVMSHLYFDQVMRQKLVDDIDAIVCDNTMEAEAMQIYEDNNTAKFEVNRVGVYRQS